MMVVSMGGGRRVQGAPIAAPVIYLTKYLFVLYYCLSYNEYTYLNQSNPAESIRPILVSVGSQSNQIRPSTQPR